jgi:tetratricopeptide (TPR) repeat protein
MDLQFARALAIAMLRCEGPRSPPLRVSAPQSDELRIAQRGLKIEDAVMQCRGLIRTVFAILWIGSMGSPALSLAGASDERDATPDAQSGSTLEISISEIESSLVNRNQSGEFAMRLIIAVKAENRSDDAITIAREQFQLLINGEPSEIGSVDSHLSFQRTALKPGQSTEGWIGFGSIEYSGHEPSMILRWHPTNDGVAELKSIDIDLNAEFRRQSDFQRKRLGPEGCLLQITTKRNLDVLAIWSVSELLKAATSEKVGRILFASEREQPPVIHEEFNLWLGGMIDADSSLSDSNFRFAPRASPQFPRLGIQFRQITVGGLKEAANRQIGIYRRPISVLPTAETAVASALTPVYRHVATNVALEDLENANPGVRRAAIAGVLDRLNPEQAAVVIDQALQGSPEMQVEIAGYLNLIPGEKSVDALQALSLSDNPDVSQTALRSLIRSLNPATESAMRDLWQLGRSRPELQNQMLSAIIHLRSEQWISLVADYVAEKLETADGAADKPIADQTLTADSQSHAPVDSFGPDDGYSSADKSLLGESLLFLQQQQHVGTLEVLRRNLLRLSDPALQDIALAALAEARNSADEDLLRECLDRRIRSEQISDDVRTTAIQLPSPQWTEMFLNDLKSGTDGNHQILSANALLRCASSTQLDTIISNFDSLPDAARQQTLRYLATLDHPRWKPLARELIEAPLPQSSERNTSQRAGARSIAAETIQLLANDASEESIAMLTQRLNRAVEEIGTTPDPPLESRLYVHRLIESVAMFAHPECRRSLNRTSRCSNPDLRQKTAKHMSEAIQRSPVYFMLIERLRNADPQDRGLGDNEDTLAFYDSCIEADPCFTDIYSRRASVLMHLNRFEETMHDLRIASRLSPENMDVESMIALCRIRLGDTEGGLKYAEELVVTAPQDLSSLYNGACSYSRALENQNVSDEQKRRYGDRAIELLRLTIATNFDDFEHLQNDEDLVALHAHPEWSAVVEETKKVYAEKHEKPQE